MHVRIFDLRGLDMTFKDISNGDRKNIEIEI
jgi:hypothetical protein